MKKIYQTPSLEVLNILPDEKILNSSLNLSIHDDNNITNEADMWSNQETELNIW